MTKVNINNRLSENIIKIKKATKRISAIGISALIAGYSVFGAGGLSNYPYNFVKDQKFTGQVVIGSSAKAIDSVSAASIIDDLKQEFTQGDSQKVKITYRDYGSSGDSVNAVRSHEALNYGETVANVTEVSGFDDGDTSFLDDGSFKNEISDTDYTQTLKLSNGKFNYALRDEVDGVENISDGIFYSGGDTYATYTLQLDDSLSLTSSDYDEDLIGSELTIMGNKYVVTEVNRDGSNNLDRLVLVGGSNKVSLGEGEKTSVDVNDKSYEISVLSVSDTKILLTVNGETKSIDEYDAEDFGDLTIAVTDLVSSSRDAVKGYAELVVGGKKISLEEGNVQINGKDVNDLYNNYDVDVDFQGSGFESVVITYKVDDDVLLKKGDYLRDVLFDSFKLVYTGTNNPKYETVDVRVNDDDIKVSGTTEKGENFNEALLHMGDNNDPSTAVWLKGSQDEDRVFFEYSKDLSGVGVGPLLNTDGTSVVFNLSSTGIKGSGFLLVDDKEDQYWYEISSVSTSDSEHKVDFNELLRGDDEDDVKRTDWDDKLGKSFIVTEGADNNTIALSQFGNEIAFNNQIILTLLNTTETNNISAQNSQFDFRLDSADASADDSYEESDGVRLTFSYDTNDKEFNINTPIALHLDSPIDFVNKGHEENREGNSDIKTFVTKYGIKVEYDNDQKSWVKVMTPYEQVEGFVSLEFGSAGSEDKSVIVSASDLESEKYDLQRDGYTIVSTEVISSGNIVYDIASPVLDTQVSNISDMIVVGGPAVNKIAAQLLGLEYPTYGEDSGVRFNEAVIRYFKDSNSVLVYGYEGDDTQAAVRELNKGEISGDKVFVNG